MKDTFTTIPTVKGAITLPVKLRKKYKIDNHTPIRVVDEGNGIISIKIMKISPFEEVILSETGKSVRLTFPKGIDPKILLKKIKEIDG